MLMTAAGGSRHGSPSRVRIGATPTHQMAGRPQGTSIKELDTLVLILKGSNADRFLNIVDEFTRECLAICVVRKLKRTDVIDFRSDLFIIPGVPAHIRSDHAPEFTSIAILKWT